MRYKWNLFNEKFKKKRKLYYFSIRKKIFLKNKNIYILFKKNCLDIFILGINFFLRLGYFLNHTQKKKRHEYFHFAKKNSKLSNIFFRTLLIKLLKINSGLLLNSESKFNINSLLFSWMDINLKIPILNLFTSSFGNLNNLIISKIKNIYNLYKPIKLVIKDVSGQNDLKKRRRRSYDILYFSKKYTSMQLIKKSVIKVKKKKIFYLFLNAKIFKFIYLFWKFLKKELKFKPLVKNLKFKVSQIKIIFLFKKKNLNF